jgi:hypothetical protein
MDMKKADLRCNTKTWKMFRVEAVKADQTQGNFLETLIKTYKASKRQSYVSSKAPQNALRTQEAASRASRKAPGYIRTAKTGKGA